MIVDNYAMIEASQNMSRAAALRIREELRHLLRAWEDAHALPHSFETKAERELRIQVEQRGMPKQ